LKQPRRAYVWWSDRPLFSQAEGEFNIGRGLSTP
jgi:hypothetical protein